MVSSCLARVFGTFLTALVLCGVGAGPIRAEASEFSAESAALIRATAAFFDSVEARTNPRERMPVIGLPLSATQSKASAGEAATLTRMGPVDHLTVYRISWYPVDRLYGTVDFMGTWNGNRDLVCGYLTWDLTDPDAPELETVSANFVDLGDLVGAGQVELHQRLLEANCAYGAVEANYLVFEPAG